MNGGKDAPTPQYSGGDQDVPSWWWTHNKTRYLWVGYGSAGGGREAFFPASVNPNDGHWSKRREADFQDADMWINAIEAPPFVGPPVDQDLAEQGAILFHSKDLWADGETFDMGGQPVISKRPPGGNGSCASCHGAYSPRFIHAPDYLPDPRLAGMAAYTVPLETIGTDPEQSNLFEVIGRDRKSVTSISGSIWMGFPDAVEGYRMPEERTAADATPFPAGVDSVPDRVCGLGALGGYSAQPLHGVWASAPYFHNGSVPTVWDVLSPATRPVIWRRQRVPESEATPGLGYRGYDTHLDRAYDYDKLGWKYERRSCDPTSTSYYLSCTEGVDVSATEDPGPNAVEDRTLFNTHGYGKGNQGHVYTAVLTDDERGALIEYMKTL